MSWPLSRPLAAVVALTFVGGCSRAFIKTEPPVARISIAGRQIGVGAATVATPKGRIVIVRVDHEGFRPACAIIEHRRDTVVALDRAVPGDAPLPSDAEIEREWIADHTDLCAARAEHNKPPDVLVTAGDLSQRYEILGDIRVDTTDRGNAGPALRDALLKGAVLATLRPELKGEQSEMLDALRDAAIARYGSRVDAVINANVFAEDRDVFARGVAVHFVEPSLAPTRTIQSRLDELDRLGASGAITPAEYRARRQAILDEL